MRYCAGPERDFEKSKGQRMNDNLSDKQARDRNAFCADPTNPFYAANWAKDRTCRACGDASPFVNQHGML
jgi:hypothetical protein